ncbi:beta-adaptin-like protein C [Pistacia vera]|uniref:beta-adaptin-like protein C n=1 Tax=Pistacia vera TaxID=55513 RepID=UPI0012638068|nr:beta-adaptin-like protein C [Pistacia vera]
MERASFLETWRSLPDSNEVLKDLPGIVVSNVEATLDRLAASNMFFIAKRKHANQDAFYFSAKIPRGITFLIELTTVVRIPGPKCAIKTPNHVECEMGNHITFYITLHISTIFNDTL